MMEVRFLKRELEIMYTLKHPGIVRLVELYENNEQLFIVMELCQQELFQVIDTKGPLQETIVQKLIQKLVETIAYLHQNAIVHRDIKPENILIVDKDIVSDIKLSDFGIARRLEGTASLLTPHESLNEVPSSSEPVRNREVRAHTKCGTRDYVAPEVMSGKGYGTIADMWSVGVVTFVLMSACAPVFLPGQGDVKQVHFGKEECWENASKEVKEFIVCLLERSPEKRMTATKALDHPWLKNVVETKNKST
jgi:serine/threonine protein kinase